MASNKNNNYAKAWYALAVTRIMIGFVFLWAFFDKLIGLGFATKSAKAWINGGSPTTGYLKGVEGPFADFFNAMAGMAWADWLFMLGLLGIGVGLILGVAIRLSTFFGALLLVFMYLASLPLANNPVIDDHLVYAAILFVVMFGVNKWSLSGWWRLLPVIKHNWWLH